MSLLCENCTKGYVLPGEPTGKISTANAYFAPAPGTNGEGKTGGKAIILLTDIFGFSIQNPKILADHFAQELDCDVWVPDQFNGTPDIYQLTCYIRHLWSNGVHLDAHRQSSYE
jgi:carboxymethylenebutenolidase